MILHAAIRQDGIVYHGKRHCEIIHDIAQTTHKIPVTGEQGFVTDDSPPVFLNRKDAAKHALACGQIKELRFSEHELFSEDLY